MSVELAEWLTGCLDEDGRVTKAAALIGETKDGVWLADDDEAADDDGTAIVRAAHAEVIMHVSSWDPARVLAEVAAKRAILDLHFPWHEHPYLCCANCYQYLTPDRTAEDEEAPELNRVLWPCPTIRAIVQAYRGRAGWRDEWGTE